MSIFYSFYKHSPQESPASKGSSAAAKYMGSGGYYSQFGDASHAPQYAKHDHLSGLSIN